MFDSGYGGGSVALMANFSGTAFDFLLEQTIRKCQ